MERKVIFIGPKRLSFSKWSALFKAFVGVPTAIATLLAGLLLPKGLQQFTPLISTATFGITGLYFDKYLRERNLVGPLVRKRAVIRLDDEGPVDERKVKALESQLKHFKGDSDEYARRLALLGFLYLRNAVALSRKDYFDKAVDYLNKAKEVRKVSEDTRILIWSLSKRIETYKYRFRD